MMIVEMCVTGRMRDRAKQRAGNMGVPPNSITGGQGSYAGFIGEYVVLNYLYGVDRVEPDDTMKYDIALGRFTADIKTKRVKSSPKPNYQCSVTIKSLAHQRPHVYIFVRVDMITYRRAWILGTISRKRLLKDGVRMMAGEYDSDNKYTCREDCINIPISQLNPISNLKVWLSLGAN